MTTACAGGSLVRRRRGMLLSDAVSFRKPITSRDDPVRRSTSLKATFRLVQRGLIRR